MLEHYLLLDIDFQIFKMIFIYSLNSYNIDNLQLKCINSNKKIVYAIDFWNIYNKSVKNICIIFADIQFSDENNICMNKLLTKKEFENYTFNDYCQNLTLNAYKK